MEDRRHPLGLRSPPEGWLRNAILSGFAATAAMSFVFIGAFYLASQLGQPGGGTLQSWLYGLAHNALTERFAGRPASAAGLHLLMGVLWAVLYAALVEPNLEAPGWQKGALFALPLWVLSVLVFLPLAGGGPYGWHLGAGPLPILGNLILHLVYGACLGWMYSIPETAGLSGEPEELLHAVGAEQGIIVGAAVGTLLGALAGWLLASFAGQLSASPSITPAVVVVVGGVFGSGIGALAGSLAGLGVGHPKRNREGGDH